MSGSWIISMFLLWWENQIREKSQGINNHHLYIKHGNKNERTNSFRILANGGISCISSDYWSSWVAYLWFGFSIFTFIYTPTFSAERIVISWLTNLGFSFPLSILSWSFDPNVLKYCCFTLILFLVNTLLFPPEGSPGLPLFSMCLGIRKELFLVVRLAQDSQRGTGPHGGRLGSAQGSMFQQSHYAAGICTSTCVQAHNLRWGLLQFVNCRLTC